MARDAWGRTIEYVRLSLTEACNFCCPYCRPKEITAATQTNLLSPEEWMTILEALHNIGIRAVRLTGGEPLLYPYLDDLLGAIHQSGWFEDISMTTNASLLESRVAHLKELGLNRVNISLDSLDSYVFSQCIGKENQMELVLAGIKASLDVGLDSVKINTVLTRPWSDQEILSLLEYMQEKSVIWRFIEYMPFQGHTYNSPTFQDWKKQIEHLTGGPLEEISSVIGFGPATYYRLPSGQVLGFIFSMSHGYCDSCNRIRFTSDGKLRLCLLRDDEVNLIDLVRQGKSIQELETYLIEVLQLKKESHDGENIKTLSRPMWRIGG